MIPLLIAFAQSYPQPHDPVWNTGKEDLKEVAIPRGVVNGYRSIQWTYMVNEPLTIVVSRLKGSLQFQNKAAEIEASALLRRGMAFAQRELGGVTQKVALNKGTFAIKRRETGNTYTATTEDAGSTVIVVTESVAPGKTPSKDWPAPTQKKYAPPVLPKSVASLYKTAPYSWSGFQTSKSNLSQFFFVFKDAREFAAVTAGLDASLVTGQQWRKSDPPPTARYTPQGEQAELDFIEAAPVGALLPDSCAVSVFWSMPGSAVGWEMPGYEYLFRKIED